MRYKSKYRNKKVIYNDIKFDSIVERDRYIYLKRKESEGKIQDLKLQQKFILQDSFKYRNKTIRAIHYIADFTYINANGGLVIEDVKGVQTTEFKLKAKMFKYKYSDILFYVVKRKGINWIVEE